MVLISRYIMALLGLLALTVSAQADVASPWQVDRFAKARLIFEKMDHDLAHIGLEIRLNEGWHTYWRAPGDAGLPPQFDWAASSGIDADAVTVKWPWPTEFRDFDYQTFGYGDRVVLPMTVPLTEDEAEINLKLSYAVCEEVCVPLNARLSLKVDKAARQVTSLADWHERVPDYAATLVVEAGYDGAQLVVEVPGGQGRAMIADTEDGRIFYAPTLDEDGRARFVFTPSALNPDPTAQKISIAVMGADDVRSVVTDAVVLQQDAPAQDTPVQDASIPGPSIPGPK